MNTFESLTNYYATHDENSRLESRHGQVEFLTTVHYVEKYLFSGARIIEIGAATGRYSHYFARKGGVSPPTGRETRPLRKKACSH